MTITTLTTHGQKISNQIVSADVIEINQGPFSFTALTESILTEEDKIVIKYEVDGDMCNHEITNDMLNNAHIEDGNIVFAWAHQLSISLYKLSVINAVE
jgi:16S rRNA A1518/A1519 N6-dimethyltransferase RsmA/KsgA/DIM1 with predicted DNA glycosylase/AP lyase activity